ncbi:MAG: hypothetical protein ACLS43_01640 [Evtepia gabavorous]
MDEAASQARLQALEPPAELKALGGGYSPPPGNGRRHCRPGLRESRPVPRRRVRLPPGVGTGTLPLAGRAERSRGHRPGRGPDGLPVDRDSPHLPDQVGKAASFGPGERPAPPGHRPGGGGGRRGPGHPPGPGRAQGA